MAEKSYVKWKLEDGSEVLGGIIRLSHCSLTCAVLDRRVELRMSEVLAEVTVITRKTSLYSGRAVVASIVNTGTHTVYELQLDTPTTDIQSGSIPDFLLDYGAFVRNRQAFARICPEFKLAVLDLEAFLADVRGWLERRIAVAGWSKHDEFRKHETALLEAITPRVIAEFNERHEQWEELAADIDPAYRGVHQDFVRFHWQPLFLCAPFAWRTFHKPLGHAGDYEMMNMIHRNTWEGDSAYAKLVHRLLVSQWPAESVRNRIAHLKEQIISETARVVRSGRRAQVVSIGCGPAWEMQEVLRTSPLADKIDFFLVDFNSETLTHAESCLRNLKDEFQWNSRIRTYHMSVQQLIIRAQKGKEWIDNRFDLVYCAGLFDYLSNATCKLLVSTFWEALKPGGTVIVANMRDTKPFRSFIEFVLEWHLIYRDGRELLTFSGPDRAEFSTVLAEPTSVNVFLQLRQP